MSHLCFGSGVLRCLGRSCAKLASTTWAKWWRRPARTAGHCSGSWLRAGAAQPPAPLPPNCRGVPSFCSLPRHADPKVQRGACGGRRAALQPAGSRLEAQQPQQTGATRPLCCCCCRCRCCSRCWCRRCCYHWHRCHCPLCLTSRTPISSRTTAMRLPQPGRSGGATPPLGLPPSLPPPPPPPPPPLLLPSRSRVCLSCCHAHSLRARQVLKLPRSGGVVVRSRELRAAARKVRVEEYFYGYRKVRSAPAKAIVAAGPTPLALLPGRLPGPLHACTPAAPCLCPSTSPPALALTPAHGPSCVPTAGAEPREPDNSV